MSNRIRGIVHIAIGAVILLFVMYSAGPQLVKGLQTGIWHFTPIRTLLNVSEPHAGWPFAQRFADLFLDSPAALLEILFGGLVVRTGFLWMGSWR